MAAFKTEILQQADTCSVCLELVGDTDERSTARLICGHQFHLDCIGSAFNAKGRMQCPNCRRVEHGRWLHADGLLPCCPIMLENEVALDEYETLDAAGPSREVEYEAHEVEYETLDAAFPPSPDVEHEAHELEYEAFAVPSPGVTITDIPWCPHDGILLDASMWTGNRDTHPITRATDAGRSGLRGDETLQSAPPDPFARRLSSASSSHEIGVEERANLCRGDFRRSSIPSSRDWNFQSPADFQPVDMISGIGLEGQLQGSQSAGHTRRSQERHQRGRRQAVPTSAPSTFQDTSSEFAELPADWVNLGASAVQNATREAMDNAQPRMGARRRRTARQQCPAAEGSRWLQRLASRINAISGLPTSDDDLFYV